MNLVLFDDPTIRQDLMPFTLTRPVGNLRVGILTLDQKWSACSGTPCTFATEPYLREKFPVSIASGPLYVNGALCPDDQLWNAIQNLSAGESLVAGDRLLAVNGPRPEKTAKATPYSGLPLWIDQVWKIFQHNGEQIRADFKRLTAGRNSQPITDPHTRVYQPENIFLEDGVQLHACVLNASTGPIYLGRNAQIQEGAVIRGPFSLGEGSVVNMGAKIRGDTTVGPHCKVGGEISNSVLYGYSNKAHDGFLGNSVIGEWCNLGADTNTSNLKNNYEDVKLWNYRKGGFVRTGQMFCGLMMGDHSKCGINTMFNTGTVVGVSANIFGDGYPRNFIPSFAWGGAAGFSTFQLNKVFETAQRAMERRQVTLAEADKKILTSVFEQSASERVWEKTT
ncbi:MAG: GlmU family protein [Cyclobacteriaceae bacterium]|nr:GlmU family protein [Cyclobacteriaceae bacterium]